MKLRIGLLIVCLVMSVSLGLLVSNSGSSGSEMTKREGKIRIGFSKRHCGKNNGTSFIEAYFRFC